jgi:hypothetical protein
MSETNDLISFAQGANGDCADSGIKPRHIPATGENTDQTFFGTHATPFAVLFEFAKGNSTEAIACARAIASEDAGKSVNHLS